MLESVKRGRSSTSSVTALHLAAANGHLDVVKALLDSGADPNVAIHHQTTSSGLGDHSSEPLLLMLLLLGWGLVFLMGATLRGVTPGGGAQKHSPARQHCCGSPHEQSPSRADYTKLEKLLRGEKMRIAQLTKEEVAAAFAYLAAVGAFGSSTPQDDISQQGVIPANSTRENQTGAVPLNLTTGCERVEEVEEDELDRQLAEAETELRQSELRLEAARQAHQEETQSGLTWTREQRVACVEEILAAAHGDASAS